MMSTNGVPFHTCGPDCPAFGTSRGGKTACYFGRQGRSWKGMVVAGEKCIHKVDRRLLKNLKVRLKRAEDKLVETRYNVSDLRELVSVLEVALSKKGL